jgi:hypothetical protein
MPPIVYTFCSDVDRNDACSEILKSAECYDRSAYIELSDYTTTPYAVAGPFCAVRNNDRFLEICGIFRTCAIFLARKNISFRGIVDT